MPKEAEPSQNEKQFVLRALQENLRIDGRAFDQFRDLELTFGDEYGVADVRLGKTRYAHASLQDLTDFHKLFPY
jgi:exosome complex component RRP45